MEYEPTKTTWLNPNIEYLFNSDIIEYDMSDAGFSLIKEFKLLESETIQELERLEKGLERHIAVGKLARDRTDFSKALNLAFVEARRAFITANNINDNNLISVKKDAFFVIGQVQRLVFGQVHFMPKHHYTSYIRFPKANNVELYYEEGYSDVKGISDINVNKHRIYMLDFINKVIGMIESKDALAKRYVSKFVSEYKATDLDETYYLEFNNKSGELSAAYNYHNIITPIVQIMLKELG